jgi:hypothetical protein
LAVNSRAPESSPAMVDLTSLLGFEVAEESCRSEAIAGCFLDNFLG